MNKNQQKIVEYVADRIASVGSNKEAIMTAMGFSTSPSSEHKIAIQHTTTPAAFDFKADLAKFVDATSTLTDTALKALSGVKTVTELGYTEPALSSGVTATYTVANGTVTVTLHKGSETSSTKTFVLTGTTGGTVVTPAPVAVTVLPMNMSGHDF